MQKFGLRGSWAKYLIALKRSDDGLTAGQMCEICDRNKADVSRAMAALEEIGIVVRNGADANYRVRFILTDKGREVATALADKARVAISCISELNDERERELFYRALETIAANLERLSVSGIPDEKQK